jgi:streptomycin 6-kinase
VNDPTSALPEIPAYFSQFVSSYWDMDEGAAWLRALPALLGECAARWGLRLQEPFPNLTFNYAIPATRADGTPVVLKAGIPREEFTTEIAALQIWDGSSSVRLLESDASRGVMLLERALPGHSLSCLEDDDQATAIAADVMRALWRPAPSESPFPTLARWLKAFERLHARFDGGTGPMPEPVVARAESLSSDLLASAPVAPMLLHGDLHHDNIIAAIRLPWLVIDPKGIAGDPCFEVGAFLSNLYERIMSWPRHEWPARQARRIDILSERLGFPRDRIIAWGVVQAALSAIWGIEDGEDDSRLPDRIARADALATLL